MADDDDEYEKQRQENIKRNSDLLLSLGLKPTEPGQSTKKAPKKKESTSTASSSRGASNGNAVARRQASRPKRSSSPADAPLTRRKSARVSAAQQAVDLAEESKEDVSSRGRRRTRSTQFDPTDYQRAPTLKRLKNPEPPSAESGDDDALRLLGRAALPTRDRHGNILFENNNRHFMPNVTPEEMLQGGIFGGTAFRPFYSRVLKANLDPDEEMREFPSDWFDGLQRTTQLCSADYRADMNRFKVKAGQTLEEWESNGWVRAQDPRGWWQWYFRFYLGRRTGDDARQIARWLKACGPAGRFKRSLVDKIHRAGSTWDDESVTPVVRQTLFHWAYQLTQRDYQAYL